MNLVKNNFRIWLSVIFLGGVVGAQTPDPALQKNDMLKRAMRETLTRGLSFDDKMSFATGETQSGRKIDPPAAASGTPQNLPQLTLAEILRCFRREPLRIRGEGL